MKFSTNYCIRQFIRVQLQSTRLRSYYLKTVSLQNERKKKKNKDFTYEEQ